MPTKKKQPKPLAEKGLIRKKALMTPAEWKKAGKPCWCIRALEQWTSRTGGWTYYRCRVPLCEDLRTLIQFSKYATRVEVGTFDGGQPRFVGVPVGPVLFVPDGEADHKKLHYGHSEPVLLWDRGLNERTAQSFVYEE